MPSEEAATAKFNVGGTCFEVSRSVLEKYPDSMLAKVSSKPWQSDPDSTIFIDADGERFRYCLDYIRYGKVYLSLSVSKGAVLQDLDYYGIDVEDASTIDEGSASLAAASHMARSESQHTKTLQEYDNEIREIQRKRRYIVVAHACFKMYSKNGSLVNLTFDPDWASQKSGKPSAQHVLYEQAFDAVHFFDKAFFNKCLAKHGLYYIGKERYSAQSRVTLGKIADQQASPNS